MCVSGKRANIGFLALLLIFFGGPAALQAQVQDLPMSGGAQSGSDGDGAVVRQKLTRKAPPKDDLFRDAPRLVRFASQLEAKGDPEKALRFAEDALAVDKNYRPALEMAARLSLQLSQPQALRHARAYAQAQPRVLAAQMLLIDALLFEGETKDLPRLLEKARSLSASAPELALRAGIAADLEGRAGAAQDIYASALAKTPDHPGLMQAMALSLAVSGDGAAALQLAQKLANMPQGDTAATHAAIARIYAANGEVDIAVRIMEAQSDKETAEAMRPFLARISQLSLRDKAMALHFSRISREALRAFVPEAASPVAAPEDLEEAAQVRVQRGTGQSASGRAAPMSGPVSGPAPAPTAAAAVGRYYVQLAAMRAVSALPTIWAQVRKSSAGLLGQSRPLMAEVEGQYRLLVGPYPSLAAARQMAARLQRRAVHAMARVVPQEVSVEEMQP